ncbi:hypothetical protein DFH28DRAFT_988429 [Melampsora americana]|nr:hypothetical protein DFH28DRAFT_1008139 [Melampsora americana]KAH9809738.1 hypothetical protein DFH28DRAFT_988429 [Melampsora americana]
MRLVNIFKALCLGAFLFGLSPLTSQSPDIRESLNFRIKREGGKLVTKSLSGTSKQGSSVQDASQVTFESQKNSKNEKTAMDDLQKHLNPSNWPKRN